MSLGVKWSPSYYEGVLESIESDVLKIDGIVHLLFLAGRIPQLKALLNDYSSLYNFHVNYQNGALKMNQDMSDTLKDLGRYLDNIGSLVDAIPVNGKLGYDHTTEVCNDLERELVEAERAHSRICEIIDQIKLVL